MTLDLTKEPASYNRTKDVVITTLDLVCDNETYNLLDGGFVELTIFESLYDMHMSGHILIHESFNIPQKGPIHGNEKLVVAFNTSSEATMKTFSKTFDVFKMTERQNVPNTKAQTYVLHLASPQQDNNEKVVLQRSFKDMTEDEIIGIVAKHQLGIGKIVLEGTKYRRDFVTPAWTPYQLINYCCKTAVRPTGNGPGTYLFYEDIDGFNFVSMDKLLEQDSGIILTNIIARTSSMEETMPYNVESWAIVKNFDTLADSHRGMYGSTSVQIDFTTKSWEVVTTDYNTRFDGTVHLEENPVRGNTPTEPERFFQVVSNYGIKEPIKEWSVNRPADIQQYEHYIIEASITGSTDIKLGMVVTFDMPAFDWTVESGLDEKLSGKYLISAIRHTLNRHEHSMDLELRKPNLKS